jgi:hypothetical protein
VGKHDKLFRAIVVMGAAMTAPACDDHRCAKCIPIGDAVATDTVATTDARPTDAGVDTHGPSDAPVDVVLIL